MFSVVTDFDQLRVERFKRATEEKLRDIRCPEHHQAPRVRFHGTLLREITISLSGCCARVMEIANARIGSPWQGEAGSAKAS
jgi:5'-3' exonuclease